MLLSKIESGPPGFDCRTFECPKCGGIHKIVIASDPMESIVRGWFGGELSAPK
jgi:hypothetical protein